MSAKFRIRVFTSGLVALLFAVNAALVVAQTGTTNTQVASAAGAKPSTNAEATPVFSDYRGVKIGMPVNEARDTVERYLKAKGEKQDFLVLSNSETAQIFYDDKRKVMAVSVDYTVKNGNAPSPVQVLGMEVQPKPDGSIYALRRYPAAGYWVSYNRTTGENSIVTVTMQAM